ncbi:MAG: TolC family protein [Hyphomicrobiaceae bacterium]
MTLEQPLFRGFQTTNAVNEVEALVRAGREELRTVEQTVLTDSVTAYMDVIRNRWIMRMRTRSREFLTAELNAVERRYASGEVTKTDVAQSKSRRALAQSQLALAKSSLRTASAVYERQIGHPPSNLVAQRTPKHLLPQSMEQAIGAAEQENPTIIAAAYREQASRFAVAKIRGELLPQVHLLANYQRFDDALVASVLGLRSSAATAESDDDLMEMAALEVDNDEAYCQAAADAPGDTAPPPTSDAMVSDLGTLVVDQDDLRIA